MQQPALESVVGLHMPMRVVHHAVHRALGDPHPAWSLGALPLEGEYPKPFGPNPGDPRLRGNILDTSSLHGHALIFIVWAHPPLHAS